MRSIIFREDGSLTVFGWICAGAALALASAVVSAFGGCMNIYTRLPATNVRVIRVYQCYRQMAALSVVASFPQMMSDSPSTSHSFMIENLLTIPFLGLPVAVDAACEAVIDTVCLPYDWPVSEYRNKPYKGCSK